MPRIEADAFSTALRCTSKSEVSCVKEMCFRFFLKEERRDYWMSKHLESSIKQASIVLYAAAKGTLSRLKRQFMQVYDFCTKEPPSSFNLASYWMVWGWDGRLIVEKSRRHCP